MTKYFSLILCVVLTVSCGAVEENKQTDLIDSDTDQITFKDNTQFKQDIAAYKTVVNVIRETGLAQNFVILPGDVKDVKAYIKNNERILEYNPEFMMQLESDTNWHGISVLAREIGHHLSHHDLQGNRSSMDEELEADRYAGFVLQKMGATLDQAILAIENSNNDNAIQNAPINSRISALSQGWNNSRILSSDSIATTEIAVITSPAHPNSQEELNTNYLYQIFLAVDTTFYFIDKHDVAFVEKNKKHVRIGEKKDSNKPGFDWIFLKEEDSYGVDAKGRLWAFSTDGKFHIVGQAVAFNK